MSEEQSVLVVRNVSKYLYQVNDSLVRSYRLNMWYRLKALAAIICQRGEPSYPDSIGLLQKQVILEDVSFEVERGNVVSVLGEGESNKMAFIKMMSGVYKPSRGSYQHGGLKLSLHECDALMDLYSNVDDNIRRMGRLFRPDFESEQLVKDTLQLSALTDREKHGVGLLHKTEKQRLGQALALCLKPDVLVMEEVFVRKNQALSESYIGALDRLIEEGASAIVLAPTVEWAKEYSSHFAWFQNEKLLHYGPVHSPEDNLYNLDTLSLRLTSTAPTRFEYEEVEDEIDIEDDEIEIEEVYDENDESEHNVQYRERSGKPLDAANLKTQHEPVVNKLIEDGLSMVGHNLKEKIIWCYSEYEGPVLLWDSDEYQAEYANDLDLIYERYLQKRLRASLYDASHGSDSGIDLFVLSLDKQNLRVRLNNGTVLNCLSGEQLPEFLMISDELWSQYVSWALDTGKEDFAEFAEANQVRFLDDDKARAEMNALVKMKELCVGRVYYYKNLSKVYFVSDKFAEFILLSEEQCNKASSLSDLASACEAVMKMRVSELTEVGYGCIYSTLNLLNKECFQVWLGSRGLVNLWRRDDYWLNFPFNPDVVETGVSNLFNHYSVDVGFLSYDAPLYGSRKIRRSGVRQINNNISKRELTFFDSKNNAHLIKGELYEKTVHNSEFALSNLLLRNDNNMLLDGDGDIIEVQDNIRSRCFSVLTDRYGVVVLWRDKAYVDNAPFNDEAIMARLKEVLKTRAQNDVS